MDDLPPGGLETRILVWQFACAGDELPAAAAGFIPTCCAGCWTCCPGVLLVVGNGFAGSCFGGATEGGGHPQPSEMCDSPPGGARTLMLGLSSMRPFAEVSVDINDTMLKGCFSLLFWRTFSLAFLNTNSKQTKKVKINKIYFLLRRTLTTVAHDTEWNREQECTVQADITQNEPDEHSLLSVLQEQQGFVHFDCTAKNSPQFATAWDTHHPHHIHRSRLVN